MNETANIKALPATDVFTSNKIELTVPIIANLMAQGHRQVDIARICNVSRSSVSGYIKRHYDKLVPLFDNSDRILALKSKHIANQALEKIENIISSTNDFNKKDLVGLNITAGTQIDKYRLLSDKSTSNVSIDAVQADIHQTEAQIKEIEARIAKAKGVIDVPVQDVNVT